MRQRRRSDVGRWMACGVAIAFSVVAASCELITGSSEPSWSILLGSDSLPVYESTTAVAVNADGDTLGASIRVWSSSVPSVAGVFANGAVFDPGEFEPRATVVAKGVGITTIAATVGGETATARLTVVPAEIPAPPVLHATYFSRNRSVWIRWSAADGWVFFHLYRKAGPDGEWALLMEKRDTKEFTDFAFPAEGGEFTYRIVACNEAGCSDPSNEVAVVVGPICVVTSSCGQ